MAIGPYLDLLYFVAGLALLLGGGELLVRGALSLGRLARVSPLFMGLVVVAFGTSAPELFVSFESVVEGEPDIAVGNIVGSNIANILLILGLGALISPIAVRSAIVFRDGLMLLLATVAFVWIAQNTTVFTSFEGTILAGALGIYILFTFALETVTESRAGERVRDWADTRGTSYSLLPLAIISVAAGGAALFFGAQFVIEGATGIARRLGVTEAVIGLSMVAIGTSLPELGATIAAATRRHTDVILGNIIGSNIFNILAVMGITSLFHEVSVNVRIAHLDMWIMLAATVVLIPFMITSWRLSRSEGLLLLVGYILYVTVLYTGLGLR